MMQSDLMHGTTLAFVSKDVGENNQRQHAPDGSTANNEHHWCWECVREMCFSCSRLFPRVHFGSAYSRQGSLIKNVSAPAELQRQKLLLYHLFVCTYEIVDFCTNIVCVQFGKEERGKKKSISKPLIQLGEKISSICSLEKWQKKKFKQYSAATRRPIAFSLSHLLIFAWLKAAVVLFVI